jgi:Vitamin K epoxide reductase family
MTRFILALLGIYGFRLSRRAGRTISSTAEQAARGDPRAETHFTQTRYARVLGPKNSDLGMIFYGAVALTALTGTARRPGLHRILMLGSLASLAMSLYLLWALLFRLRVWCPVCMKGHALNLLTFLTLRRLK